MKRLALWAAGAAALVFCSEAAAQLKSLDQLNVYDASGKIVGPVYDIRAPHVEGPAVALRVDTTVFYLGVTRVALTGWRQVRLLFELADCAGQAWLESANVSSPATDLIPLPIVGPPGQTLWVLDPNGTRASRTSLSQFTTDEGCIPSFTPAESFPVVPVINLEGLFTPPFSIRPPRSRP